MIHCSKARLTESIRKYGRFGKTDQGGITRLSLSEADIAARQELNNECSAAGLKVNTDDLGNIYAIRSGTRSLEPIVIGSHMDSVKKGGNYDGILGVLTAKEVIQTVVDNQIQLKHSLILVDFTNEEGARFEPSMMSSGILTGYYQKQTMFQTTDRDGITFAEALTSSGFAGPVTNRLTKGHAYVELHIEQGPVLEAEHKKIGVVEGVVGMVCFEFRITGISDHAGTTPMHMRTDPLILSSKFVTALYDQLSQINPDMVFTIGRFDVKPNIHTIIPSDVIFTLDIRHRNPEVLKRAADVVESIKKSQQEATKCTIKYSKVWQRPTVDFASDVVEQVEKSVKTLGYSYKRMYSGAGHDAEFIASMIPTAMIFVPSILGKSHCENEKTSFEDCANGADVLLHTVLGLDG